VTLTRHLTVTLFLSAFLLFCCQPMVGKMVLPSLGGAASVWTTCVLFFQSMLLAGYLYVYFLGRLRSPKQQLVIHMILLASVFLTLPIRFGGNAPAGGSSPVAWELAQLVRGVALPFFVVSATAPLLQSWFSRTKDPAARDPYFLYAASNAGSLLALLLYPFVFEPRLGVSAQSLSWLVGYVVLVVFVLIAISEFWKLEKRSDRSESVPRPSAATKGSWLAASFVPSALMLAVTTHLSVNLASVPFLWTLPLAVYLLTFILAFGRRVRISSEQISFGAPVILLILLPIFTSGPIRNTAVYLSLLSAHLLLLFVGGLLCHTSLARLRPATAHLTEYYAWIAFGGALGGVFAAVLAPLLFSTVLEYPFLVATLAFFRQPQDTGRSRWDALFLLPVIGLVAAVLGLSKWLKEPISKGLVLGIVIYMTIAIAGIAFHRRRWLFAGGLAAVLLTFIIFLVPVLKETQQLYVARNFFGVKQVLFDQSRSERKLLHGDTMHGLEGLDPARSGKPLSYYTPSGPFGDVMAMLKDRPDQHIGVLGLGSGTIAAYTESNREITFFEIDPQVEFIARRFFSFLPRCGDRCNVVLGDGRLSIQQIPDQEFDLLVLDAFNSDAIPAHLPSSEALALYQKKLKPDGAILFHVSNRYLRIRELITALAFDAKLPALYRTDDDDGERGKARSSYVILALDTETLSKLTQTRNWFEVADFDAVEPWTDDYSNLFEILKWE
jgi:SAM-dependent methyltransferase